MARVLAPILNSDTNLYAPFHAAIGLALAGGAEFKKSWTSIPTS
jgi:hypothetical protein